jgi:hypothetical protein
MSLERSAGRVEGGDLLAVRFLAANHRVWPFETSGSPGDTNLLHPATPCESLSSGRR